MAAMRKHSQTSHPPQAHARADVWEARALIERESIRQVPPHPYMGRAMRFEDEYSALQLTGDGRFSYSILETESNSSTKGATRRVTTYEGVCAPFDLDSSTGFAGFASREPNAVEGRALLRHEAIESDGASIITRVDRDAFTFAIAVSPFTSPSEETLSTVQACSPSISLGSRCRRLPYVGRGPGGHCTDGTRIEKPSRSRGSRLRFCPVKTQDTYTTSISSSTQLRSPSASSSSSLSSPSRRRMPKSVSATTLPQITASPHGAEWKQVYKRRPEHEFGALAVRA